MNPRHCYTCMLVLLATCNGLFITGCSTSEPESKPVESRKQLPRAKSATASAKKMLAITYLEKAEEQLGLIKDSDQQEETGLAIANTYATLNEKDLGRSFLPPLPPLPDDASSFQKDLPLLIILTALSEYEHIEAYIQRLDNPQIEALLRSFVVYYDAVQHNVHLTQSLKNAAECIHKDSPPEVIFYLAYGYHMAGHPEQARKTCRTSSDSYDLFATCAYMAATMGLAGEPDETAYYLELADTALSKLNDQAQINPYTRMMYGRALAYAGRLEQATEIYVELNGDINVIHIGSVLTEQLRKQSRLTVADAIIQNVKSTVDKLSRTTDQRAYLFNCYGDFLISLEMFDELGAQLKQTKDPLLKANLLTGGAQALADAYTYGH